MIAIKPQATQLEQDMSAIDAPLVRIESRAAASIRDLNLALDTFWSLPDARLLAVLNFHGPDKVQEIFAAHALYAEMFNRLMADRGRSDVLARTGIPREITFNPETGLFELVPPPVVEEPEQVEMEDLADEPTEQHE